MNILFYIYEYSSQIIFIFIFVNYMLFCDSQTRTSIRACIKNHASIHYSKVRKHAWHNFYFQVHQNIISNVFCAIFLYFKLKKKLRKNLLRTGMTIYANICLFITCWWIFRYWVKIHVMLCIISKVLFYFQLLLVFV